MKQATNKQIAKAIRQHGYGFPQTADEVAVFEPCFSEEIKAANVPDIKDAFSEIIKAKSK